MKALTALLSVAIAAAPLAGAQTETYTIDPVHSTVGFKVKHFFSKVSGRFNEFSGTLQVDPAKPENAKVEATIKVGSVDTANADRDKHLRDADFFDEPKFGEMKFKSKKVKLLGENKAEVTGDLTIRDVTKEVPLTVEFLGKGQGMYGPITGWSATTTINRRDFGLTWGKLVEGVAAVGDEVEVQLEIEAVKAE